MDLQGGSHSISQVDGVSDMVPAYQLCGGRAQQRDNGLCLPQCQTLQSLPVYHWCPSSCHPGARGQRERACIGEFMCGFPKGNCLGLEQPPPLTQSPLVFTARSCGDLFSWLWNPGLGLLTPKICLLNFYPCGCGASPFCIHAPPICLDGCGFFNNCSCQISIQLGF